MSHLGNQQRAQLKVVPHLKSLLVSLLSNQVLLEPDYYCWQTSPKASPSPFHRDNRSQSRAKYFWVSHKQQNPHTKESSLCHLWCLTKTAQYCLPWNLQAKGRVASTAQWSALAFFYLGKYLLKQICICFEWLLSGSIQVANQHRKICMK